MFLLRNECASDCRTIRCYVYTTVHYSKPGEMEAVKKELNTLREQVQEVGDWLVKIENTCNVS